jgi:hypothetical protein
MFRDKDRVTGNWKGFEEGTQLMPLVKAELDGGQCPCAACKLRRPMKAGRLRIILELVCATRTPKSRRKTAPAQQPA